MVLARVLIIDDSEFIIKVLTQNLEQLDCIVADTASSGYEALEKYKKIHNSVDLITLDISMPEMDGIETLKKILTINPKAKVIMVSSLGYKEKVKEAVMLGAKHFIVKPFTPALVKDVINYVMSKQ